MGPREEDNSFLLLGAVAAICALIAFAPVLLEPSQAVAAKGVDKSVKQSTSQVAIDASNLPPARVVVPFSPNTTPSER